MPYLRFLLLAIALFLPFVASAIPSKPLSIEEHNKLVPSRICLDNVAHFQKLGAFSTGEKYNEAVLSCVNSARESLGRDITWNELVQNVKPSYELSGLQKAAGWLEGFSILQVFAGIGIAVFGTLFAFYAFPVFVAIPKGLYELILYAAALGSTWYGLTLANGYIYGFIGTILFIGALAFSAHIHNWKGSPSRFSGMVMVYAAIAAFLYQSTLIGFVAVTALMCAVGFIAESWGLGYVIGFEDEKDVPQGTATAFLILAFYVGMRVFNIDDPYIKVFAPGAYWMGSFVGFLGLIIMASKWYPSGNYALMNFIVVPVAGVGAILIGSIYGVPELAKIGGTFFGLWFVEKYVEVTFHGILSGSFFGLIGSLAVFKFTTWAIENAERVGPYLLFIS